jgi:hypothetical protein
MKRKKIFIILTIITVILMATFAAILMFLNSLSKPRTQLVIGKAESTDKKYEINVVYVDYGGSYGENGGIHIKAYLTKNTALFPQKYKIDTPDTLPCYSEGARCNKEVVNNNTEGCKGKPIPAIYGETNGKKICTTEKLEDFQIKGNTFTWYGTEYDMPLGIF